MILFDTGGIVSEATCPSLLQDLQDTLGGEIQLVVFNLNFGDLGAPCGLTRAYDEERVALLSVSAAGGMERAEWMKEDESLWRTRIILPL